MVRIAATIRAYRDIEFSKQFLKFLSIKNKDYKYMMDFKPSKKITFDLAQLNDNNDPILFYHLGIQEQHLHPVSWKQDLLFEFKVMIENQRSIRIPGIFFTSKISDKEKFNFIKDRCTKLGFGWVIFDPPNHLDTIVTPKLLLKFEESLVNLSDLQNIVLNEITDFKRETRAAKVKVETGEFNRSMENLEEKMNSLTSSINQVKMQYKEVKEQYDEREGTLNEIIEIFESEQGMTVLATRQKVTVLEAKVNNLEEKIDRINEIFDKRLGDLKFYVATIAAAATIIISLISYLF